jgi:ABC-2 type transport system ATP-binding protein
MKGIICLENIRKVYGSLVAVEDMSFEVEPGIIFGLLGPNGAGKTTVLKILTTLLRPTSGKAYICGYDIAHDGLAIRRLIGVVFQENNLDRYLTARGNLVLHAKMHRMAKKDYQKKISELLALTGLSTRQNEYPDKFSGGMQRRLAVARALVHSPKLLFLDEPTTGLDPQAKRVVWDYLISLKGQTTIFLTTHNMEEAEQLCDRIIIMDHGRTLIDGSSSKLKSIIEDSCLYEIEFKDKEDYYLPQFKELTYIKRFRSVNGRAEIALTNPEHINSLLSILDFKDIKRVGIKEPSLEDVFLYLTGREIREC